MALISTDEAKVYLRVDSSDDDALIGVLLSSSEQLCVEVARLTQEQWDVINADTNEDDTETYTEAELANIRSVMKVAILYALGYLYEHREEADHHDLTLTLRSILFAIREGVNF